MEETPICARRRTGKRPPLTVNEKVDIVHKVLKGFKMYKDVAKEHRISVSRIS